MMSANRILCRCCVHELFFPEGMNTLECAACGTLNTRPPSQSASADLTRAVQQRMACDFDDAAQSYQQVLRQHPGDHEALWGLVLCRYGVQYIETAEPGRRRLPVCRFVQRRPVSEDGDFLLACENAPEDVRAQYREEAVYLDKVLADVRRVEETTKPYDIFLCYKASVPGVSGAFTDDFDRAREIYAHLVQMGYHVFFAHGTLQRSAGTNFEAQIYHALKTARVMLVICSRKDYLLSPWVRSEWTRYLEQADRDPSRHLVPLLYDDPPASSLPPAFVSRQLEGVHMRGLNALDNLRSTLELHIPRTASETDLIRLRIQLALEEGSWDGAARAAALLREKQPNRAAGYMGQLLAEMHLRDEAQLAACTEPFETTLAWTRALHFASADERRLYEGCLAASMALRQLRQGLAAQQLTAESGESGVILREGCCDPSVTALDIPRGVTALGDNAFAACTALTRITLPDTLVSIGACAFSGCSSLREIVLPDRVTVIGSRAFADCAALHSVRLPAGLISLGAEAFLRCFSLRSAVVPAGVRCIQPGTFRSCAAMTALTLPASLEAIGAQAFMECSRLRILDLPPSLTTLGEGAFEGCFGLLGLVLPEGVRAIPARAFRRCSGLREADLPRSLDSIGSEAFAMCVSLREVSLPVRANAAPDAFSTCLQLRRVYK